VSATGDKGNKSPEKKVETMNTAAYTTEDLVNREYVMNSSSQVEHEASTSRIGEDQLFYCRQRGLSSEDAVTMIVNGFCR
jgi:hypothetical protein